MSVRFYMDVHVPAAITRALRVRGVDVLTTQEDQTTELPDPDLLDRAAHTGRVLFTRDVDLVQESARRQQAGIHFAGVVYAHQLRVSIGRCINDLEVIAKAATAEEMAMRLEHLPL